MKCPIDDTELAMAERQGIEVDYCPKCRGVWLDRGELDKIIERSGDVSVAPQVTEQPRSSGDVKYRDDRSDHHDSKYRDDRSDRHGSQYHDDRQYGSQKHHKKKSLLSELFDF